MINLLSPAIKEQVLYSRRNRQVRNLLVVAVLAVIVMTGIFVTSLSELNRMAGAAEKSTTEKQDTIKGRTGSLVAARDASKRLLAIKQIQAGQTHFSDLLNELAKITPKGTYIESLALTGDEKKPVRISVISSTYASVLSFREILAGSGSVSGVDMENIGDNGGSFRASMVVGFKLGQTK